MPPILEILTLTLQSIAMAVFNLPFIMVVFIILYQRHQDLRKQIPLYRRRNIGNQMKIPFCKNFNGVEEVFIHHYGIPIRLTPYLYSFFLLLFALFNVRYLCFHMLRLYLYFRFLFQGQEILGYTLPDLQVDIGDCSCNIMHLMEATLIFLVARRFYSCYY